MKQRWRWLLVALVLLCALIIMLMPRKPVGRVPTELSFLCFSNSATSPEVVFAVHFPPRYGGGSWRTTELDRWEGGVWKAWNSKGVGGPGMQLKGIPLQGTLATNGKRITLIASYPLPNTNDSWRLRTQVDEMPPLSIFERFPILGRNSRQASYSAPDAPGRMSYWMTNVVGPAADAK